ncbi:MAG TPA: hypothetical protein VFU21_18455 [Kofleriaceae bacterium]|nr:hypothetical protein [Kofleriaceae bacterium]
MKIALTIALLVASLALPSAALAAPPSSASAIVDITETDGKGKATTSKVETVLLLDRGTSRVDSVTDGARTEIVLAWRSDKGAAPILDVEFGQERERKKTRFSLQARVATGKRAVLTDVVRSDGSRFTLAVTLK